MSLNTVPALGRTCAACGKERKLKALRYDPNTLIPYCEHPYVCSDRHPNSPVNLIDRGEELKLTTYAEANEAHKHRLIKMYDAKMVAQIRKILQTPTAVRIQDPDMATFLVELLREKHFGNLSDTIRYCIENMMDNKDVLSEEFRVMRKEQKEEERIESSIQAVAEAAEAKARPKPPRLPVSPERPADHSEPEPEAKSSDDDGNFGDF